MAQFSIKKALGFSFSAYGKHLVLLLCASSLIGVSMWLCNAAPRYVAQRLGVYKTMAVDLTPAAQSGAALTDQSKMVLQKVQKVTAKVATHLKTTSKSLLGIVFLVFLLAWGLYLFLILGFMKLGLHLTDKNNGSLEFLFESSLRQVFRFIGATLLLGLYAICGIIGIGVLTTPFAMLCTGLLGDSVTIVLSLGLWVVLFVAVMCWLVGYAFYGYCIVDKPNIGARDALRMSRDMSHGSRGRIILAFVLVSMIVGVVVFAINKLFFMNGMSMMQYRVAAAQVASTIVISPFWILFCSFIYRSLSK